MAAAKGNKNAVGNRGGGRKSAYAEKANADFLAETFFKPHTQEEIRKMLQSGKYAVSDVLLSKALAGDMKAIVAILHKLFPDKHEVENKNLTELLALQNDIRALVLKKGGKKDALPTLPTPERTS